MKATINIPDDLYRRVKAEAALRGLTIREVTTRLYQRWLSEDEPRLDESSQADWPHSWLRAADEAIGNAPPGPSALQHLRSDRNRLEPR